MYTTINFKTKKALKEAIASGQRVHVQDNALGGTPRDGTVYLEGPHYPAPHTWYAKATVKDGVVVKVS